MRIQTMEGTSLTYLVIIEDFFPPAELYKAEPGRRSCHSGMSTVRFTLLRKGDSSVEVFSKIRAGS